MEQTTTAENPGIIAKRLLKKFKRPKSIVFQKVEGEQNYAQFIAEPFEKGFGITIGNCLRRILLSSIEGVAIVAIKIDGIEHEFSTIEGIQEDVSRIILNLKRLHFSYLGSDPVTIDIEKTGAGFLTGADLEESNNMVQILNKDVIIANLNKNAKIKMSIQLDKGRGYLPANEIKKTVKELGVICLDALFSPIERVNVNISETMVEQQFDYDKLILDVWTNGTMLPEDAVACAAKILKEHISVFINFEEDIISESDQFDESEERTKELLVKPLESLELSVRTLAVLKSLDMKNLGDLVSRYEEELSKSKHYSDKVLLQLKEVLSEYGLSFGMRD